MLNWNRKEYLSNGNYILEEATFQSAQRITLERDSDSSGKIHYRVRYYIGRAQVACFVAHGETIEEARKDAYRLVHEYVENEIWYWNNKLLEMWKTEDWEDEVEE